MSLVEQIILLWCALALAVSVNAHNSVGDRGRGGGWYHINPTFISTRHCSHHTHDVLINTRGGSTEGEDDSNSTTVEDNVEAESVVEEVPANDDDDVATSPEDDDTSSVDDVAKNYTFSATTPHDGSAEDPDGIPSRFLLMKKGDREGAKESFESTLAWRKEFNVDTILNRPHPLYDVCKAMVPHYFAGEDPHGNIVFVQRPALLDFELMKNNNATIDDLLMHYIYVIEYCWNILEPGPPEGVMTNILDMRGMSFRAMRNQEYIEFGKRFVVSFLLLLALCAYCVFGLYTELHMLTTTYLFFFFFLEYDVRQLSRTIIQNTGYQCTKVVPCIV